jgi:hypothetical protein
MLDANEIVIEDKSSGTQAVGARLMTSMVSWRANNAGLGRRAYQPEAG